MPQYTGLTLAEVVKAIDPGQPSTLETAADNFAAIRTGLEGLANGLRGAIDPVTTGSAGPWHGPAAEAFIVVADRVLEAIGTLGAALEPYEPALDGAALALTNAQTELAALTPPVPAQTQGADPLADLEVERINARAREILETLASAYATATLALKQLPSSASTEVSGGPEGPEAGSEGLEGPAALEGPEGLEGPGLTEPTLGLGETGLATPPPPTVPAGLTAVDLGAGGLLTLGRPLGDADPSTLLAGYPGGSLGGPAPAVPVPAVGAPGAPAPAAAAPAGLVAPGAGYVPALGAAPAGTFGAATHLTTASRSTPTIGSAPAEVAGGHRPSHPLIGMPMGGPIAGGSAVSRSARPPVAAVIGRGEEDKEEREPALAGDQVWDDGAGTTGAIGRPGQARSQ